MGTIHVNYDVVKAETARMRSHIRSSIVGQADAGYRQVQSSLRGMDGAANASLRDAMEVNRQKAAAAAHILERLYEFIATSAREIEVQEQRIARSFNIGRR